MKQSWCDIVTEANGIICKGFGLVCHKHFSPSDTKKQTSNNRIQLQKNAVPSHNFTIQNSNDIASASEALFEDVEPCSNSGGILSNQLHLEEKIVKDMEILKLKKKIETLKHSNRKIIDEKNALINKVNCLEKMLAEIEKKYKNLEETLMVSKRRSPQKDNVYIYTFFIVVYFL